MDKFAVVAVNGKVYVVGMDTHAFLARTLVYDPAASTWARLPPMTTPREDCSVIANADKIYAIGGRDLDGDPVDIAEVFDPVAIRWTQLPPMATSRFLCELAVLDDNLYVVGGFESFDDDDPR